MVQKTIRRTRIGNPALAATTTTPETISPQKTFWQKLWQKLWVMFVFPILAVCFWVVAYFVKDACSTDDNQWRFRAFFVVLGSLLLCVPVFYYN